MKSIKNLPLQVLCGIIRHILTGGGGVLAAYGIQGNNAALVSGIVLGAVGFFWSLGHKGTVNDALSEASALAQNADKQ